MGKDTLTDWYGDDWDDCPYDCNAETVYKEYIHAYTDVSFPFDSVVLEPKDGCWKTPCRFCKDDMRERKVPCLIVIPAEIAKDSWVDVFNDWVGSDKVTKFYFGDKYETMLNAVNSVDGKVIQIVIRDTNELSENDPN